MYVVVLSVFIYLSIDVCRSLYIIYIYIFVSLSGECNIPDILNLGKIASAMPHYS